MIWFLDYHSLIEVPEQQPGSFKGMDWEPQNRNPEDIVGIHEECTDPGRDRRGHGTGW